MPHTNINHESSEDIRVEVHWVRDQFVQVTTASKVRHPAADVYGMPAHEEFVQGAYVSLDRPGLNRLIRTLRQARDQAFGRDE